MTVQDVETEAKKPAVELPMEGLVGKAIGLFVPQGELTLLVGDPGVGKSLVGLDFAARLTGGQRMVQGTGEGAGEAVEEKWRCAFVLSAEDSLETTKARAKGVGGLERRVLCLPETLTLAPESRELGVTWFDGNVEASPLVAYLGEELEGIDCRMVILDPLPAFLGKYDGSGAAAVRALLKPLLCLGQAYGFGVLGITHLNKGTRGTLLHRTIGSLAYTALARSVLLAAHDEEAEGAEGGAAQGRRLLIPLKNNYAPTEFGLAYRIVRGEAGARLEWENDVVRGHPLMKAGRGRREVRREDDMGRSQFEFAVEFLRRTLAEGPVGTAEVLKEARSLGISKRTVERAREAMGVVCRFEMEGRRWVMGMREGT